MVRKCFCLGDSNGMQLFPAEIILASVAYRLHQIFLKQRYEAGDIPDCSMRDMYRTIVTLSTAPYLALHFIQNVVGFTKERTEEFLANSRAEMIRLLQARYTVAR